MSMLCFTEILEGHIWLSPFVYRHALGKSGLITAYSGTLLIRHNTGATDIINPAQHWLYRQLLKNGCCIYYQP